MGEMDSDRVESTPDETPVVDSAVKRPALARQRQTLILEQVREHGAVRVADLVTALGVSDMTVRRDLELLQERGLIEKVHGGAAAIEGSSLFEPGFTVKSMLMEAEKELIAATAASLVTPGHRHCDLGRNDDLRPGQAADGHSRSDGADQLRARRGRSI
jgi:DNA-binding transcriptional MocR family regulator